MSVSAPHETAAPPFGLLNVAKPAGVTSRDVVNRVQWLLRQRAKAAGLPTKRAAKVGHAGTLDPIASGVLVLCVGKATRLIEHVQRMPKRYVGTFLLGRRSPSDDIELEPELLPDAPQPTREAIEAAALRFVGTIEQRPPAYSAIKIGGRKAYDLARAGDAPEMPTREVTIHTLDVVRYAYPELVLDLRCGSGTYVRALGRDLAESLGTGAVMSALGRTEIGPFRVDDAVTFSDVDEQSLAERLLPATLAVGDLPFVEVTLAEAEALRNGRFLERPDAPEADELAAVDGAGDLVALVKPRGRGVLQPTHNFR